MDMHTDTAMDMDTRMATVITMDMRTEFVWTIHAIEVSQHKIIQVTKFFFSKC